MAFHSWGGGKTAPRLAEDLTLYDLDHPGYGRNLLSAVPPVFDRDHVGPQDYLSPDGCRHNFVTKTDQTFLAKGDGQRRPGTSSKVSAVCTKCRGHLQVVVNHTRQFANSTLTQDHIHHLNYRSGRQKHALSAEEITEQGQVAETYHYDCSHPLCTAMVSLRILSPLLTPEHVQLLTDPEVIRKRAEEAIATSPDRLEGMAIPQPITVLDNLRLYLANALRNDERNKAIHANNKRFMLSYGASGSPCKRLLEFLGFENRESDGAWVPPQVNPGVDRPYQDEMCIFLDDIVHELLCLIHSRPASEKRGTQLPALPPSSSDQILHALDASNYPKSPQARLFTMAPAPFYEDLGAVEDMSASLILDAYDRQMAVDPGGGPHYLKCLKNIGLLRGGEDMEIIDQAVQVAYADGKYTDDDVAEAYRYFDLWRDDVSLTEEIIIEKFYTYLRTSSASDDTEARKLLWRIGHSRGSEKIMSVSEDQVTTAEQAQIFLGVDDKTPDDFIMTMYTAKVDDNPPCKEMADRAVQLIAESRNSTGLNHFINTGETVAGEMDVGDAYRLLQIPDRMADEQAIIAAYTICIDEIGGNNPDQITLYNQALCIIAREMGNPTLKSFAGLQDKPDHDLSEWPIGLRNIGNTCYLNSLLQFYFSIRPYRDMVLASEGHLMDLSDDSSLAKKQVGSRKVNEKEIERSLKFLTELGVLFSDMITSPQSSVTPSQELARLTLISPSNEAAIRRRSTITSGVSQGIGEIDGAPILGPVGPPQDGVEDQSKRPGTPNSDKNGPEDDPAASHEGGGLTATAQPADPSSIDDEGYVTVTPPIPEPPNRPPPVPPRPTQEVDRQKQLLEEVEIGAQQDVTEVINNVLFQSQCAIKPRGIADDGEQIDQIKDLFYGQTRSYISTQSGTRSKDERWCDIKVNVAGGSRDIYAAIDGAFDRQRISVEGSEADQFAAISRLPPILQVQVQRVQFDSVKKSSFKSTNHLQLLETIYMDRYMDTQKPEIMEKRRQGWEWKEDLRNLEARRAELFRTESNDGLDMAGLFNEISAMTSAYNAPVDESGWDFDGIDYVQQFIGQSLSDTSTEVDPALPQELDQTSQHVEAELKSIDEDIDRLQACLATQWLGSKILPYRLYAVFVHRGTVSFGHYWIYIYDFRKDIWRKYNDEYVTEVQNLNEIFENSTDPNPPTPYFLVYVNEDKRDLLVDPVCRDIQPQPNPDQMEGVEATASPAVNQE